MGPRAHRLISGGAHKLYVITAAALDGPGPPSEYSSDYLGSSSVGPLESSLLWPPLSEHAGDTARASGWWFIDTHLLSGFVGTVCHVVFVTSPVCVPDVSKGQSSEHPSLE